DGRVAVAPSWSPDGETIAFYAQDGVESDLFTINANGTDENRLTSGSRNEDPSWSSDGKLIAFASNREGGFDIYTISIVDQAVTPIVRRMGTNETEPTWCRPFGKPQLCFTSDGRLSPSTYWVGPNGRTSLM